MREERFERLARWINAFGLEDKPNDAWREPLRGSRRVIAAVFLLEILVGSVVAIIVGGVPSSLDSYW